MKRRRQPFTTAAAAGVYREAERREGFTRRRAERVYQLTTEYFAQNPYACRAVAGDDAAAAASIDRAVIEISMRYVPGLFEMLAWAAAKLFVRWLIRRLISAWLAQPTEFRQVLEDLE